MPVVFPRDKFITRSRELGEKEKEEEERNHRDSERGREREEYQFFVDGIVNALAFLDYAVTRFRRSISTALGGYLSRLDPLFFATDLDQVSILRSDHDHATQLRDTYHFRGPNNVCIRERNCNAHFQRRIHTITRRFL